MAENWNGDLIVLNTQQQFQRLYQRLGHEFHNPTLLEAALTHRSVRGNNNERLEFLGDSIVNFLIAEALFRRFPHAREGELSRLRAELVKGDTLAELAQEFTLGEYLRLGAGELKSGGFGRKSILADAMEAVIAAIYLDAGMDACRERIVGWYQVRLNAILHDATGHKDPKTRLQEYLQARKLGLPIYTVLSISGEAHQQVFHVVCKVPGLEAFTAEGSGPSRRSSEQTAAQKLLSCLEEKPHE